MLEKTGLFDIIQNSQAELLPFFLEYNFHQKEKKQNIKTKSDGVTAQVHLIANRAWSFLIAKEIKNYSHEDIGISVKQAVEDLSDNHRFSGNEITLARKELTDLLFEDGPLGPLYQNQHVTDIVINSYKRIQCVHDGELRDTQVSFRSEGEFEYFLTKRVPPQQFWNKGWYEGVLNDIWGTRVTATKRKDHIEVVLRIPRMRAVQLPDLLCNKTLPPSLALWLSEIVSMREANVLIVGPPRCGKTTLLHSLLALVFDDERICIVEHTPELGQVLERHEWFSADLPVEEILHAITRKIPERLVVSEVGRPGGVEVFVESVESGFKGVLGSMVAGSAEVALARCGRLLQRAQQLNELSQFYRVVRSIQIIIVMGIDRGMPCLMEVVEVDGENPHSPLLSLVRFCGEERGKRQWELLKKESYWIDLLRKRGREIEVGGGIKEAAFADL
jgi:Flp pilus assembly CpaF family ATPase